MSSEMHESRAAEEPPGPVGLRSYDDLAERLRELVAWSGRPYREIHRAVLRSRRTRRIVELPAFSTVYRCMQRGRTRLDADLVVDIVRVIVDDEGRAAEWRQACHALAGRASAAAIVTVLDRLPEDRPDLTGRAADVARVLDAVVGGRTPVVTVEGMAGVGKTTLATHVGHRLVASGRYADLQLSVNLRGFDGERPPADPAAVLDGLLRHLGVRPSEIHGLGLAGRTARFRELLAGRSALLVLDNAATEDQVYPLLPLSPTCLVLVTSRRQLAGLPGATIPLEVLTRRDAVDLLRRLAGGQPVDSDLDAASRIVDLVGCLPLAVAVMGARIRAKPGWTVADQLHWLVERRGNLQLEDGVDLALGASYDGLSDDARRALRLLALHPGGDVDPFGVAALLDAPIEHARQVLVDLRRSSLLEQRGPDRYEAHDLVRTFAAAKAHDEDANSTRGAALTRLLDHYRFVVSIATEQFAPHTAGRHPVVTDPGTPVPEITDRGSARAWLDQERQNLVSAARYAAENGSGAHTSDLSTMLYYYLDLSGYVSDAVALHRSASRVAPDPLSRGRALNLLGCVYWRLGRYRRGRTHYQQALDIAREAGDLHLEGVGLANVALGHFRLGQYEAAVDCHRQALAVLREYGSPARLSTTHGGLGRALVRMGRVADAEGHLETALALARDAGDQTPEEAYALANLGYLHGVVGRCATAVDLCEQALALSRALGFRAGEIDALNYLGRARLCCGSQVEARAYQEEALEIAHEVANVQMEIEVHNDLGLTLTASGQTGPAIDHHRSALAGAERCEDPFEQARAHQGLAEAYTAAGDRDAAAQEWEAALALTSD